MTADIMEDGQLKNNVTFDFKPYQWNRRDIGYSDKLKTDVVLSTFSRRGVCIKLGIPYEVKSDMRNAEFAVESQKTEFIDLVRRFINRRGSCDRGHIGEWIEVKENTRWKRKCTRCGAEEVTEVEPKEVTRAKKEKEIQELEEKLRKLKSEL